MTTLSGKLPKGDKNGLDELVATFVNDPRRQHVVVAVVDTSKIVQNLDTGDEEPTLRILRIERVSSEDARDAEKLVRRALERRLGMATLPIEVESEITSIFDSAVKDIQKNLPKGTSVEFKAGHQPPAKPDEPVAGTGEKGDKS